MAPKKAGGKAAAKKEAAAKKAVKEVEPKAVPKEEPKQEPKEEPAAKQAVAEVTVAEVTVVAEPVEIDAPAPKTTPAVPAEKRKAVEETAPEEPTAKEAKKTPAFEEEVDAVADKRVALKQVIGFNTEDTTVNVIPAFGGKVLASVVEGGLQYLFAGARANVGAKAGRYMFEVSVLEQVPSVADATHGWKGGKGNQQFGRQSVRVGFSTSSSGLVLGDSEEQIFFDLEGGFTQGKQRKPFGKPLGRQSVLAVVLNLDAKSANKNTISLFADGVRAGPPQQVPECMQNKALFPHVGYRSVKLQVNMGPTAARELPFKCRMLGAAADADTAKVVGVKPKDGKYEVVLPVGFPDEGTYDWVDEFVAKNPQYTELSDRKILDWAAASGVCRNGVKSCNDKPEWNFNVNVDELTTRKVLNAVSAVVPRNYVVMEVKAALLQADRKEILKRFAGPNFKRTAKVVMGEPPADFKKVQHKMILKSKQAKADLVWRAALTEKRRKQQAELRQKQIADARKKAEELRKNKGAKQTEGEEKAVAEDQADGEEKSKDQDAEQPAGEQESEPPQVELTEEELKLWFAPRSVKDLKEATTNKYFGEFTIPAAEEGFNGVEFEWQNEKDSATYLRKWVIDRKRSSKIEHLQPGKLFVETHKEWLTTFAAWQSAQSKFRASEAGKKSAAKKKEESDEKVEEEPDIFSCEDVLDVGNGSPLFRDFAAEDWALLQLRFELYLLRAAFDEDKNDADRPGVSLDHFAYYYNKYFKKPFSVKQYGVDNLEDLAKLVKDTVCFKDGVLAAELECPAAEFATFLKHTEGNRRERQRRIDAGDETSRLNISPQVVAAKGGFVSKSTPGVGGKPAPWKGAGKGGGLQMPRRV